MNNKNKIYLLYPPISKKERYSSELGASGGEQIPLGIFYLASYLRKNGFEVKVTDAEAEKITATQIIRQIKKFYPQYIGISSSTVVFHRALEVANSIKENFNDIFSQFTSGDTLSIIVSRGGVITELNVPLKKYHRYNYELVKIDNPTDKQQKIYDKWLSIN